MDLSIHVMVSNITNLSEARFCAGSGVQLLSFTYPTVDISTYNEIVSWLHGPEYVLDISQLDPIPNKINDYHADYWMVSFTQFNALKNTDNTPPLIVRLDEKPGVMNRPDFLQASQQVKFFIVQELPANNPELYKKMLLQLPESNSSQIETLPLTSIAGIILNGSSEIKPGLMNYDNLSSVLAKLTFEES